MNNDNGLINDLIGLFEIFNIYTLVLLFFGGLLIWGVNTGLTRFSGRLMEKVPTRRFLILQISTLLSFALYIFGTIGLVVGILQPPKEFLIAAGGAVAVALGFALKDVVASLVAGVLLLFDRPFRVGDRVTFGDTYGEIVSIGLRTVRLVTLDDNLVTIPNSRFITDVVASGNAGELDMMVVTDFHVSLQADLVQARKLIEESSYDGEELTFLVTRAYPLHFYAAVIVQQQLQEVGLNVNLAEYDWATLLEHRSDPEAWDMFASEFTFEPTPINAIFLHSRNEYAGWTDSPEVDRLIEEIRVTEDQDKALELFTEMQAELMEYTTYIRYGNYKPLHGLSAEIEGFTVSNNIILSNLSVAE